RDERDAVDPLLSDVVLPRDLAGVGQDDDVGVAKRRNGADHDLLAVIRDVEAGDAYPRQWRHATRIPARGRGFLSSEPHAADTHEQTSCDDEAHAGTLFANRASEIAARSYRALIPLGIIQGGSATLCPSRTLPRMVGIVITHPVETEPNGKQGRKP